MFDGKTKEATARIELALEDVPAPQRIAGTPQTGVKRLGDFGGVGLGVWEMTPGTMSDTEVDEIFVMLSGAGTIAFEDGTTLPVEPGDIVRLHAGQRTVWTVTRTLRKMYLTLRV
jgi:uncharacterized cupin superfamily protein